MTRPPEPRGEVDRRYSVRGAEPRPWADVVAVLEASETFWLTTVRPDGRPHTVPLLGVWVDSAWYFVTGPAERKSANLAANAACTVTTGVPQLQDMDVIIEGTAEAVPADKTEEREAVASAIEAKYVDQVAPGSMFEGLPDNVRDADVLVFRVSPRTVFGFVKGEGSAQIRWRF